MRKTLAIAAVCFGLLTASRPAEAHHAFAAEFDASKPLLLKGTVVKWELVNPHSWIHLDVKNADGSTTRWMVEGGSPNSLFRLGFSKESLPKGTEIVVDGYQAKDGSMRGNGRDVTFKDGRKLFLGSSGTGAPKDGRDATEPPK